MTYVIQLKSEGPLDGWEIPYFVRKFYDELFDIGDRCYVVTKEGKYETKTFTDKNEPLRMVSKTLKEGLMEGDMYRLRAWEYRTYNISSLMGMSFNEWLSLPPHRLDALLDDIRKEKELLSSPPPGNGVNDATSVEEQRRQLQEALIRGSNAL